MPADAKFSAENRTSTSSPDLDNFAFIQKCILQVFSRLRVQRHIIGAVDNYAARKRSLITPHSRITATRGPSRRPVTAQYRGGVARIMTDEGDVINGGSFSSFIVGRDGIGAGHCGAKTVATVRMDSKTPRWLPNPEFPELSCKTLRFQRTQPSLCFWLNAFP